MYLVALQRATMNNTLALRIWQVRWELGRRRTIAICRTDIYIWGPAENTPRTATWCDLVLVAAKLFPHQSRLSVLVLESGNLVGVFREHKPPGS
jgi:hypothetical protein